MNSLMLRAVARPASKKAGTRFLSDYAKVAQGWAVEDIDDFIQPGKYTVQTFNKISAKVRNPYLFLMS